LKIRKTTSSKGKPRGSDTSDCKHESLEPGEGPEYSGKGYHGGGGVNLENLEIKRSMPSPVLEKLGEKGEHAFQIGGASWGAA